MHPPARAIVLVPNFASHQKDQTRDRFVDALLHVPEGVRIEHAGKVSVPGGIGVRLRVHEGAGKPRELHVFEAFWHDLVPLLSQQSPRTRVMRGGGLFAFWAAPRVWAGVRRYPFMLFNMVVGLLLVSAWYVSTVAMFFTAVGSDPLLLLGSPTGAPVGVDIVLKPLAEGLGTLGTAMGGWRVWAVATLLIALLPVAQLVDLADFARRFLLNDQPEEHGIGVRTRLQGRLRETLDAVASGDHYEEVTVAATSFGTAIAVDVLADWNRDGAPIRLLTLGGPLELLSHRSAWVAEEIERCLANPRVWKWIDCFSNEDWFCTPTPFTETPGRHEHRELKQHAPLVDKLTGRTHQRYFDAPVVLRLLLDAERPTRNIGPIVLAPPVA
jgi:hypothetical protein